MALGEVRRLRRPVVHLAVDVHRPVGAPRRADVLVPDALQVGGLGAGAGARDEQVAAVLEDEGHERGVLAVAVGAEALVGRAVGGRRAEVEPHPAEEAGVVGDVRVAERRERLRRRRGERPSRRGVGVLALAGGRLVEAVEARRRRDEEDGLVRPAHLEPALRRRAHGPSAHDGPHDRGEPHALGAGALVVADRRPSCRRGSWGRRGSAPGRAARSRPRPRPRWRAAACCRAAP